MPLSKPVAAVEPATAAKLARAPSIAFALLVIPKLWFMVPCTRSSGDRALPSGGRGRTFESSRVRQIAWTAIATIRTICLWLAFASRQIVSDAPILPRPSRANQFLSQNTQIITCPRPFSSGCFAPVREWLLVFRARTYPRWQTHKACAGCREIWFRGALRNPNTAH